MSASRYQVRGVAEKESDRNVSRVNRGSSQGENQDQSCSMAQEIKMEYERHSDVMHVDLCFPSPGAHVDVVEVGEMLGFPGQIIARVDLEERKVYGLTIQNFSGFKWKLIWMYRMTSIRRALLLMLNSLRAAMCIERQHFQLPAHV
jgi:hypothetical protein